MSTRGGMALAAVVTLAAGSMAFGCTAGSVVDTARDFADTDAYDNAREVVEDVLSDSSDPIAMTNDTVDAGIGVLMSEKLRMSGGGVYVSSYSDTLFYDYGYTYDPNTGMWYYNDRNTFGSTSRGEFQSMLNQTSSYSGLNTGASWSQYGTATHAVGLTVRGHIQQHAREWAPPPPPPASTTSGSGTTSASSGTSTTSGTTSGSTAVAPPPPPMTHWGG